MSWMETGPCWSTALKSGFNKNPGAGTLPAPDLIPTRKKTLTVFFHTFFPSETFDQSGFSTAKKARILCLYSDKELNSLITVG